MLELWKYLTQVLLSKQSKLKLFIFLEKFAKNNTVAWKHLMIICPILILVLHKIVLE